MSRRNWNPETVFSGLVSSPFWISRLVLQLGSTTWFYFLAFRAVNPRQKSWRKLRKKSQEESRIGFQERNPGEDSRRKIQERRGIWNHHTVAGGTGGTGG